MSGDQAREHRAWFGGELGTDKKKPAGQNFFVSDKGTLGDPLTEGMDDSLFADQDEEALVFKTPNTDPKTPEKKGLSDETRDRFNLTHAYEMARELGGGEPTPITENLTSQGFDNAALLFRSAASGGFKAAPASEQSEPKEETATFGVVSGRGKGAPDGPSLQLSFGGSVPPERLPRLLPDASEQEAEEAVDTAPPPAAKTTKSKISFVPAAPVMKPKATQPPSREETLPPVAEDTAPLEPAASKPIPKEPVPAKVNPPTSVTPTPFEPAPIVVKPPQPIENDPASFDVPTPAPMPNVPASQAGALASLRPKAQTLASLRQQTGNTPPPEIDRAVMAPPPKASLLRRVAPAVIICSGLLLVGGALIGALFSTGSDLRGYLGSGTTTVAEVTPPPPPANDTVSAQLDQTGMSAPNPVAETSGDAPIVLSQTTPVPLPGAPDQLDADLTTIARPALKTTDPSRPVTEGFEPASNVDVAAVIHTEDLGLGTGPADQPTQRLRPGALAQPTGTVRASKNLGTVLSASPELRAPQAPALTPERPRPLVTTRLQDSVTQVASLSSQLDDSALPELNSGPDRILAMLVSNKPAFDDGTVADLPAAHRASGANQTLVMLPNGPAPPAQALAATSPDASQVAVWSAPDADGLAALLAAKISSAPEAWTPDLDFKLVRKGVDLIVEAKDNQTALPAWVTPGARLVSVNGNPLEAPSDLTKMVAEMHPDAMTGQLTLDLGVQQADAILPRQITHHVGILRTIRLNDGTQLDARFDGRKWITAVTSAGDESGLVPGDILLRDYGRKKKLTEAQSLEDLLAWARAEGLNEIEFAIVRDGALESGTLSIVQ